MRSYLAMVLASVALTAMVGCNGGGEKKDESSAPAAAGASAGAGKKLRLAIIPKGQTHEYWKSVHEGAETASAELGNVELIWKGPLKEDDRESQVKVVEDFITNGVDGIALAPLDDVALRTPAKEAVKNNIPVVIFDSALKDFTPTSYVATDNVEGGRLAAQQLVKVLGGKGTVLILRYQEGSASTMDREKGFTDEIAKTPGIKLIDPHQFAGATVETAQKASENLINSHKQGDKLDIDGIYTPNESSTFGMLLTLQSSGVAGKVKFVGFDSSAKLLDGLKTGYLNGLVVQNPRKMGYESVKALANKIANKPVEARVNTGAILITKENIDTPDNQKLLAAPKS